MNIAIGGSAANPPHIGHAEILRIVMNLNFNLVIWVPYGCTEKRKFDNKTFISEVSPYNKMVMTELTFPPQWKTQQNSRLIIDYSEIFFKYIPTFDKLNIIKRQYPNAKITWFTGSDSNISEWHRGKELLKYENFLIIPRKGFESIYQESKNITISPIGTSAEVSSSKIRELIKNGETIEGLVTPSVDSYIRKNRLYV